MQKDDAATYKIKTALLIIFERDLLVIIRYLYYNNKKLV